MRPEDLLSQPLPGAEMVAQGIEDLRAGRRTRYALLVAIGGPRLRRIGFEIPQRYAHPEILLYQILAAEEGNAAHARYNALIRRLVSFERAAECARCRRGARA